MPLFDANNSDDVIFGGWDDDFLHGASGDDAIGGGEALPTSYVQHFSNPATCTQNGDPKHPANAPVCEDGLIRTDWTRPYNRGNLLLFGADDDPWLANKPLKPELGEFYLYDEYDPRRAILFNTNGTTWGCAEFTNSGHHCPRRRPTPADKQFFLNFDANDAIARPVVGCGVFANNGTCLRSERDPAERRQRRHVRRPRQRLALRRHRPGRHLRRLGQRPPERRRRPVDVRPTTRLPATNCWANESTDTHPIYEDRATAAPASTSCIGNTGGDRLIDWVGEHNSYLVPFSAVRDRHRQPPERAAAARVPLRALGERRRRPDPRLRHRRCAHTAGPERRVRGRAGPRHPEDKGYWQQQSGPPSDPQPGNIGGNKRDVLRSANFNNGKQDTFAVDSGNWEVVNGTLSVAAASLGQDAAAVFYLDDYKPVYFEITAKILAQKPTGGWKSNAYIIFDYFGRRPTSSSPGSTSRSTSSSSAIRDASGWHVVSQGSVPGSVKADTWYDMLVVSQRDDGRR